MGFIVKYGGIDTVPDFMIISQNFKYSTNTLSSPGVRFTKPKSLKAGNSPFWEAQGGGLQSSKWSHNLKYNFLPADGLLLESLQEMCAKTWISPLIICMCYANISDRWATLDENYILWFGSHGSSSISQRNESDWSQSSIPTSHPLNNLIPW